MLDRHGSPGGCVGIIWTTDAFFDATSSSCTCRKGNQYTRKNRWIHPLSLIQRLQEQHRNKSCNQVRTHSHPLTTYFPLRVVAPPWTGSAICRAMGHLSLLTLLARNAHR